MPSESIAGFIDRAQASRVLVPEQVEQLMQQPDVPQTDLTSLCAYLQSRGVLTRYQAEAIREGRGHELSFAGYPIIDKIGPCPGGTAYRVLHPSLRTPLVLRKLDAAQFGPTDTVEAVVDRARAYGTLAHTNMLPVLDAGIAGSQPYAVLDQPPDSADLGTLLKEVGGAMPAFLAAEYGWSIASVLRAVHERGGWHGEVRPGLLHVGPVTTKANPDGTLKRRPAPNATVKLAETGLIPKRPSVVPMAQMVGPEDVPEAVTAPIPPVEVLAYLPPERIDSGTYEPSGDIYGLGATLYLLLAGRAPFVADTPDALLAKVRSSEPVALTTLRPDIPADLAALVMKMLAKKPDDRPHTAADVCEALAGFCRPGTLPTTPREVKGGNPNAVAVAVPHAASDAPMAEAAPAEPVEEEFGWGVNPHAFTDPHPSSSAEPAAPRKRRGEMTAGEKRKAKMWMLVGLGLHLTGVALLIMWLTGVFDSSPPPRTDDEPKKEDKKPVTKPRAKKDQG